MIKKNPWLQAKKQLAKSAEHIQTWSPHHAYLTEPERGIQVHLPLRLTMVTSSHFKCYRVQHTSHKGPYKGGIRFHPEVSMDGSKAASLLDDNENSTHWCPLRRWAKAVSRLIPKTLNRTWTWTSHTTFYQTPRSCNRSWPKIYRHLMSIPIPKSWNRIADEYAKYAGNQLRSRPPANLSAKAARRDGQKQQGLEALMY